MKLLTDLSNNLVFTGNIKHDATAFLRSHDYLHTVRHSAQVAAEAQRLARRFGVDAESAFIGGWLHDISTVIPNDQRIAYAEAWQIEILPAERQVPMIVHQKLSAYIAEHLFGITDSAILSAIGCHTTLKSQASKLDEIVFIADKLRWDGQGDPPYLTQLQTAIADSLETGVNWFINYLWQGREQLLVIHPWLAATYQERFQD